MMTFAQFVWLDVLVRRGGSARFWEIDEECRVGGSNHAQFKMLRKMEMVLHHSKCFPYLITERGRIAHALQSFIYARRAQNKKRAA